MAFEDTWTWTDETVFEFEEIKNLPVEFLKLSKLMIALESFLGRNDLMAYLTMMANRLVALKRVLKKTGSIYLHCDPTASHYLKFMLDCIFDIKNFRNEIIWAYESGGRATKVFSEKHDVILRYSKSNEWFFDTEDILLPREEARHNHMKKGQDPDGRVFHSIKSNGKLYKYYADEGVPPSDVWTDISHIQQKDPERVGYPTQKPLKLLERIIKSSCPKDGIVLDPFCGCGTAVHAAEKLGYKWIGIDITYIAVGTIEKRLKDAFPNIKLNIVGLPTSLDDVYALIQRSYYQFQAWACSRVGAYWDEKKGGDAGIDGRIQFLGNDEKTFEQIIVSVKGGQKVGPHDLRDLRGTMNREKAVIGVYITWKSPTPKMKEEAASADLYKSTLTGESYRRIQIITVAELLNGKRPKYPGSENEGIIF